jgi:hypothetical protein
MHYKIITLTLLLYTTTIFPKEWSFQNPPPPFKEKTHFTLKNPYYKNETFSSDDGGIIEGESYRIQAQQINYYKDTTTTPSSEMIKAKGNLMMDYKDTFFTAEKLFFNITEQKGTLYNAETQIQGWYVGGKEIEIQPDGSFIIKNAHITSCESHKKNWEIQVDKIKVEKNKLIMAENFKLLLWKLPVFWLPKIKTSLSTMLNAPINYKIGWGGGQGPRLKVRYRFYTSNHFNSYLHIDYRIQRGFGGALSATYQKDDTSLYTRNYIAYDTSILNPEKRNRYRYDGIYKGKIFQDNATIRMQYDRLSDRAVVTDFYDKNFNLEKPMRTELLLNYPSNNWIININTCVKINPFQSVLQKVPSFTFSLHPRKIASTKIISTTESSFSYLDYQYTKNPSSPTNYNSIKYTLQQQFYYPVSYKGYTLTPKLKLLALVYTNGPENQVNTQPVAWISSTLNHHLYKNYQNLRHTITPYLNYNYIWTNNTPFRKHYIFDISDAYTPLNQIQIGCKNNLYYQNSSLIKEKLSLDLYSLAYFNQHTMKTTFQTLQAESTWHPIWALFYKMNISWDLQHHKFAHFNTSLGSPINDNIAFNIEFLHRSPWDWRKSDYSNYMINTYRTQEELLNSPLSDQRNTFITHTACRLSPTTTFNIITRNGWARKNENSYTQWRTELSQILYCTWKFDLYYLYTESEKRVGINLSLISTQKKKNNSFFLRR